ncbi:MAG: hypothetical protein ACKOAD_02340, partial [Gammaproteobacteria bacterium]
LMPRFDQAWANLNIQVRSRFETKSQESARSRTHIRLRPFNWESPWQAIVLVIMNVNFEANEIYGATRQVLEMDEQEHSKNAPKASKSQTKLRGGISLARFKALADCIWMRS